VLTHQQQQHLRTLRRSLNRAVTALKGEGRVVLSTGWSFGRAFGHPRLSGPSDQPWPEAEDLYLLFPEAEAPEAQGLWHQQPDLIPSGLLSAMDFFWPGPLVFGVRCPASKRKLKVACPWHPLMRELLARHGACLWVPLSQREAQALAGRRGSGAEEFEGDRALVWPEPVVPILPTYLDASTTPWRLMESGFVEVDELSAHIGEPFLLSEERAFPHRALRTFIPQYRTVVLEASSRAELPVLVERFREAVGPEWSLRVYLDEGTAHTHFPEDRGVRVYGEMRDPERVRRRLEAMLERQRRRSGKRILLIGVAELDAGADSLKADLLKMADRWMTIPKGGALDVDEFR
jgi:hypothetical protein